MRIWKTSTSFLQLLLVYNFLGQEVNTNYWRVDVTLAINHNTLSNLSWSLAIYPSILMGKTLGDNDDTEIDNPRFIILFLGVLLSKNQPCRFSLPL